MTRAAAGEYPQRILIADDSPVNLAVLEAALAPYTLTCVTSGEEALDAVNAGLVPDLILLDVVMPGLDGFEVCRRIKHNSKLSDVPVMFITASEDAQNEVRSFELGAVDYITKPLNLVTVRARVRTQLALRQARLALARQNELLEERVLERTLQLGDALKKLQRSSLDTIVRLSRAAEYKDESTGHHVLRVGHLAAAVGRALGLSTRECDDVLSAAPLHDVGKIGIPDSILLNPGALNPSEWKIMQQHTLIGARILSDSDSDVICMGQVIALTHHEKWNGTGYPNGLRGTAIPLVGRIVAIVDVFDALTSRRPYKTAMAAPEAFELIRNGRGEHFDPEVADAFFSVQPEIQRIKADFPDGQSPTPPFVCRVARAMEFPDRDTLPVFSQASLD